MIFGQFSLNDPGASIGTMINSDRVGPALFHGLDIVDRTDPHDGWNQLDHSWISNRISRRHFYREHVLIHSQGARRCTIAPQQIGVFPSRGVGLVEEASVISHD